MLINYQNVEIGLPYERIRTPPPRLAEIIINPVLKNIHRQEFLTTDKFLL